MVLEGQFIPVNVQPPTQTTGFCVTRRTPTERSADNAMGECSLAACVDRFEAITSLLFSLQYTPEARGEVVVADADEDCLIGVG